MSLVQFIHIALTHNLTSATVRRATLRHCGTAALHLTHSNCYNVLVMFWLEFRRKKIVLVHPNLGKMPQEEVSL
jgi:hypothetical protein